MTRRFLPLALKRASHCFSQGSLMDAESSPRAKLETMTLDESAFGRKKEKTPQPELPAIHRETRRTSEAARQVRATGKGTVPRGPSEAGVDPGPQTAERPSPPSQARPSTEQRIAPWRATFQAPLERSTAKGWLSTRAPVDSPASRERIRAARAS
jgi:hypothetical protein